MRTGGTGKRRGEGALEGAAEGVGEGPAEARGRSECERARATGERAAGVTSLSDRRWLRRRVTHGESASVTLMLML